MVPYFYKITNLINGKYYYGSTIHDNLKKYGGSNKNIKAAYKKYGKGNFKFEKLKMFETREEAFEFEERFLRLYNMKNNKMSYNMSNHGKGGDTISQHPNRDKIIKKIGRKGRISNRKGIPMEEEQKEKISKSLKESYKNGRPRMVNKGSKLSSEHKAKISEACKGKRSNEKNGMWGKGKPISINGVEYQSISEAARKTGVHVKTITYRINNKNEKEWKRI